MIQMIQMIQIGHLQPRVVKLVNNLKMMAYIFLIQLYQPENFENRPTREP